MWHQNISPSLGRLPHLCQLCFPLVPDHGDGNAGADNRECENCGHYNDADGESAETGVADSRLCAAAAAVGGDLRPDAAHVAVASHVEHRDGDLPLAAGGSVKVVVGEVRSDNEVVVPKKSPVLIESASDFGNFPQAPDSGASVLLVKLRSAIIQQFTACLIDDWTAHSFASHLKL